MSRPPFQRSRVISIRYWTEVPLATVAAPNTLACDASLLQVSASTLVERSRNASAGPLSR